jgi:hypothetical protein
MHTAATYTMTSGLMMMMSLIRKLLIVVHQEKVPMEKDPHPIILHCLLSPSHEKPPPVKNWKDELESHLLTLKNSSDGDDVDGWKNLLADLPLFAWRGTLQ